MHWKTWLADLVAMRQPERTRFISLPDDFESAWGLAARTVALADGALAELAAERFRLPPARFDGIDPMALHVVTQAYAAEHHVLPLRFMDGRLQVAIADPADEDIEAHLRFASGRRIEMHYASPVRIGEQVNRTYGHAAEMAAGRMLALGAGGNDTGVNPIIKVANLLLAKAVELGASDVHLQPHLGGGLVRMRVDGVLRRVMTLPKDVCDHVVRHLLATSGMDSSALHLPQDGRHQVYVDGRRIDLRVSMLPSRGGQSMVIRLLDQSRNFSLGQLGFSVADSNVLLRHVGQMHGIILFTGPTGCGKTTSLYALLAGLNRPEISIATIEDPVEYEMPGLSQTEVNERRGLTFDVAVRSLMRQDPNVMLIGEIRDEASAQAAARAALTGHLVLSTLHTNSALTALPRLLDLGLSEPVLGEVVVAIASQRLLRKLCDECAVEAVAPLRPIEQRLVDLADEAPARRPIGCEACSYSGYRGRVPIVAIYEPSTEDRAALMSGTFGARIVVDDPRGASRARSTFEAVVSGMTSVEEAERVLGFGFWIGLAHYKQRPVPVLSLSSSLFGEGQEARTGVLAVGNVGDELRRELEAAGYAVYSAENAAAANELLQRNGNIHALLVDLQKRGTDAEKTLRVARQSLAWAGLPAVVIIPAGDMRMRDVMQQHLPDHFLEGPVEPDRVVQMVRAMLS
jgi:type IV pilus assembly protein PilB